MLLLYMHMYMYMCMCRLICKYHPKYVLAQEEAQKASLQSRVKAFLHLLEAGRIDTVPLWADCVDDIINTMDAGESYVHAVCAYMYICTGRMYMYMYVQSGCMILSQMRSGVQ